MANLAGLFSMLQWFKPRIKVLTLVGLMLVPHIGSAQMSADEYLVEGLSHFESGSYGMAISSYSMGLEADKKHVPCYQR